MSVRTCSRLFVRTRRPSSQHASRGWDRRCTACVRSEGKRHGPQCQANSHTPKWEETDLEGGGPKRGPCSFIMLLLLKRPRPSRGFLLEHSINCSEQICVATLNMSKFTKKRQNRIKIAFCGDWRRIGGGLEQTRGLETDKN